MSYVSVEGRKDSGFTLVETLVSLVMLTLSLAALIALFSTGFRGIRSSDLETAALHLASRNLALTGSELPLRPGRFQGTSDSGLEWSVLIEPYELPRSGLRPAVVSGDTQGIQAYWVVSEVRWSTSAISSPRSISLTTLKLAAP